MTIAEELVAALKVRGWKLAVAESLTGGALCSAVVAVPGASAVLLGGVVAYATSLKHSLLGVNAHLLTESGPVHPQVALQMARGVCVCLTAEGRPAEVGISTTGVAGPDSQDEHPVGTVYISVVTPEGAWGEEFSFAGDRASIRAQTVDAALLLAITHTRE